MLGGWQIDRNLLSFVSGDFPQFGNMIATGNPCISNPTPGEWFNTSVFQPISSSVPYTLRTNPLQYSCLTGPKYSNLDGTLSKSVAITEKVRMEFRLSAYNALNKLNRGDPDTNIYDSTFGKALYQGSPGGNFGPIRARAATTL